MAELAELSKELFNGEEVRILGNVQNPLFVAADIGRILGAKKIRNTIGDFDDSERVARIVGTPGGDQEMILLTEKGLYKILFTSRKKEAKAFQDWVFRVLKEIRLTGSYIPDENRALPPVGTLDERILAQYQSVPEASIRPAAPVPVLEGELFDINDYCDKPCVYLLHLRDNDYKFGVTGDMIQRHETHEGSFDKHGCTIRVIKVWECPSMKSMQSTEKKIKNFAKYHGIQVDKYGQKEILTVANIGPVIECVNKYVREYWAADERFSEIERERRTQEYEIRKLELEVRKIELEARTRGRAHVPFGDLGFA